MAKTKTIGCPKGKHVYVVMEITQRPGGHDDWRDCSIKSLFYTESERVAKSFINKAEETYYGRIKGTKGINRVKNEWKRRDKMEAVKKADGYYYAWYYEEVKTLPEHKYWAKRNSI